MAEQFPDVCLPDRFIWAGLLFLTALPATLVQLLVVRVSAVQFFSFVEC